MTKSSIAPRSSYQQYLQIANTETSLKRKHATNHTQNYTSTKPHRKLRPTPVLPPPTDVLLSVGLPERVDEADGDGVEEEGEVELVELSRSQRLPDCDAVDAWWGGGERGTVECCQIQSVINITNAAECHAGNRV